MGTVERVTLRATRLRDGSGRVWHVPNGAVLRVANLSKASTAVLDVVVPRNVDLDAVHHQAGLLRQALVRDERVGSTITGAPGDHRIVELADDRLVLRATVATVAGRQTEVEEVGANSSSVRTGPVDWPSRHDRAGLNGPAE